MLKSCLRELASHLCDVGTPHDHDNPTAVPGIPAAARPGVSCNPISTLPSFNALLTEHTSFLQICSLIAAVLRRRSVSKFTAFSGKNITPRTFLRKYFRCSIPTADWCLTLHTRYHRLRYDKCDSKYVYIVPVLATYSWQTLLCLESASSAILISAKPDREDLSWNKNRDTTFCSYSQNKHHYLCLETNKSRALNTSERSLSGFWKTWLCEAFQYSITKIWLIMALQY